MCSSFSFSHELNNLTSLFLKKKKKKKKKNRQTDRERRERKSKKSFMFLPQISIQKEDVRGRRKK